MNNKVSSYNDLTLLTKWIDNQRAFERHKKKLDDIYENLHKKSVTEFGFINKTFEELQHKIKTVSDLHKFMDKGKF
jgi:translation initiation factor 2 alpha subunit (eIF-2alpha)